MVSSRDAGHHRESVGLHPTPCIEQPFNRDLRIPAVCLSGFLLSVSPQAVPARFNPAFWLSLVRSCRDGTSPERHIGLQPTIKLSRFEAVGQRPSYIESEKAHFARCFKNFFLTPIGIGKGRFIYSHLKFSKFHTHHEAGHRGCEMVFIEPIGRNGQFCMRVWGAESPSRCPVRKARMGFRVTPGGSCPDKCAGSDRQRIQR